jgi:TldD protein
VNTPRRSHPDAQVHVSTRREFLSTTSLALAGTLVGARALHAGVPVELPAASPLSARAFLPNVRSASDLEMLATRAVDAARSAGAAYADVRVGERHWLLAEKERVILYTECTYGVRALVDGAWGFAYGREPAVDAIAQSAREATMNARGAARLSSEASAPEWVPASVVTGEWRTPIRVDPFDVPVQQHAELHDAVTMMAARVPGVVASFRVDWTKESRVFAATTGSLVLQQLHRMYPMTLGTAHFGRNAMGLQIPILHGTSSGYEALLAADLGEQFKTAAAEAARLARIPRRAIDVGRYPVVLDGYVMAHLLVTLLGQSLELDRALGVGGDAAGAAGGILPLTRLGTAIATPLLTVRGHRALPSVMAVQWDDEGNVPLEHVVIQEGVLQDYHTSGDVISALKPWYGARSRPLRANGCAIAPEAQDAVTLRPPHLTMTPSTSSQSLTDLCKEINKGIVAINQGWIRSDQQLSSGSLTSNGYGFGLFEVSRGAIVGRLQDTGLQFNTLPFLKTLAAVGDRTTVRTRDIKLSKGMPWTESQHSATAPAALFKEGNVISTRNV